MPAAAINGVQLHYEFVGYGEPLLLIMGYGMPGDTWLGSLPFLQGFRAIYYDNRGTGRSSAPDGAYTIEQMAADAVGLLDHLAIDRAHVYGVSMGGMIAQELALRESGRTRALVLGCTMCGGEHSKMADPEVIETLVDVIPGRHCRLQWRMPSAIHPDSSSSSVVLVPGYTDSHGDPRDHSNFARRVTS